MMWTSAMTWTSPMRWTLVMLWTSMMKWISTLWLLPFLYRLSLAALPNKPENISCVFYYKQNFTCTWSPEKEVSDTRYTVKRTYLYGEENDTCPSENRASCSFFPPTITYPDNFTIEVEAQNEDGLITSNTTYWYLDNVVKIEPPEISSVKPVLGVKQMIQVKWRRPSLAPVSADLKYTLRFRMVNSAKWNEVSFTENAGASQTYNLTGLQASTEYVLSLQCAAEESWFWSDWSREKMGTTEEEAPFGLDLWRVLKPAEANGTRPVQLLWKKVRGAPVLEKALGYNIRYYPENSTNLTKTKNVTDQQLELCLGDKTYQVSVISYNSVGNSPEATMRIPAAHEKSISCIKAMEAHRTRDLLVVEWQGCDLKVDRWVVEWFPDSDSKPSTFSWESVSQARNWTVQQDKLEPFVCYNISVHPLFPDRKGEPYSIQAYGQEGVPSRGPQTKAENIGVKTVTITWKEIPKSQRNGFINNYTIFYKPEGGIEFSKTVNSNILRYDLQPLTRNTPYTVQVMANTSAGGLKGPTINFKTLSISITEIILISSLVGGGLLILISLMVVCGLKKRNQLKRLCWPDVPNPAESSIAIWRGEDFKNKLNLKEIQFDNSVNTEENRILKPLYGSSDLIDKLVVNFENILEEVSTEEPLKHQENMVRGEKNEYVASTYMPSCSSVKRFQEPLISAKIPPIESQPLCVRMPKETCSEAKEKLTIYGQSLRPDDFCDEGLQNPYLKNSVTIRQFLVSEKLPDQTKREV